MYSGVRRGPRPDQVGDWSLALCLRAITLLGVGPIWVFSLAAASSLRSGDLLL